MIVSAEGYVLTNYHVVEAADAIEVALADGRQAAAKVVGADPETDLAVLKLAGKLGELPVATFADKRAPRVGDVVLAIGNPSAWARPLRRASCRRWGAMAWVSIPMRISSRPTRRSIPAIRAVR